MIRTNDTSCECKPGYYYDYEEQLCTACNYGTYKSKVGNDLCNSCGDTRTTRVLGALNESLCTCAPGFYKQQTSNGSCLICPRGAVCPGGIEKPIAGNGYYRSDANEELFIKCQIPEACDGNDDCAKGYEGYLCGDCTSGYYRRGAKCYKCDTFAGLVLYFVIVAIIIFLVLLFVISYKPSKSTRFAALRIGWSFIQVTALYAQFELNWPKEIKDIYKWLSFVILDIQITSPECSIGRRIDYYLLLQAKC
jgi:hypothetical protein